MAITPSKYLKNKQKSTSFNFRQSLENRIGADTFNSDIEQFNKDYGSDYLSNWHSADEINAYYDRLTDLNDRTKAYQTFVSNYGTDEQKSALENIGKQVSAYDEIIGARQDVLDYYSSFANADAYAKGVEYATQQEAAYKAEQERIANLNIDALRGEIANIDEEILKIEDEYSRQKAQYDDNLKKVHAVPNANINDVMEYERYLNSLLTPYETKLRDLNNKKSSLEEDIKVREAYDRNKKYTDILGSEEFASFVPTEDKSYDAVEKGNNPEAAISTVGHTTTGGGMSTADMAVFQNYGSARYGEMTDEEYKLYKYLQETYGQEVAAQYAYDLDNELISRYQDRFRTDAEEHPILDTIASLFTSPLQGVDFISGALEKAITGNVRQGELTAATSAMREGAKQTITNGNKVGGFLYDTGMSMLDSILAMSLGGSAGGAILGASAASSAQNDVLARGGTAEQAFVSGIASGFFEGFFESFSIGALSKMKPEEIVKNFKVFATNALKSVATNASEELATEVANIVFDSAYMGELSNAAIMFDQYMRQGLTEAEAKNKVAHELGVQALGAAASGALMGFGFSAFGGGVGLAKVDKARVNLGKKVITEGKLETLLPEMEEYYKGEGHAEEQKLLKKIKEGISKESTSIPLKRAVGKLVSQYYQESKFKEKNKTVAEQSAENLNKTRENANQEAKKVKVDTVSPDINYNNMPKILGFDGANLNKTIVETADGTAAITDMSISNADIASIYSYAVRLGNAESANAFIENWDQQSEPFQYYLDFLKFQTRGLYAPESYDNTMSDYADVKISPMAKHAAFKSGISLRESAREKAIKQSEALKEEYKKLGGKAKKGKFNDSKLNYSTLTQQQKDVVNFTRILSDYLGVNVEYFVSQKGKRGANGYYRQSNNTIYLDINAGIGKNEVYSVLQDCLVNTISHEVVHNMKTAAPAEYNALRDFILDRLSKQEGYDLDARIEQIVLENSKQGFTAEDAIEEIVAMSCEDLLGSSAKLQETMSEFYEQNEKAANSFTKFVREVLARLKAFFETIINKKSGTAESMLMAKQSAEFISELQKRYDAALLAMREGNAVRNTLGNLTAAEQVTLAESGIAVDETTGDVHKVRNSVRYSTAYKNAKGNIIDLVTVGKKSFNTEAIAKLVATATGRSIEDARKWINSEMTIANLVMDNPEFLDFEPDDRYEGIKKNSDYPQGTVDLSNNCPKREEFTTMFDLLQKQYPDKLFTAADVASMREILKKHGITVACGACFVEDRRQLLGEIADTYINMWKEAVENGTPLQKTNAEGKKIKLQVTAALAKQYGLTKGADIMATDTYIPTQYDLTTYEGFKLLEKNHPIVAMGFNRYNNSRGQQAGRLIEGRAEYNRQILGWTPNKVKTVNNNGGLRIFSFSDFEVVHLLDLVQVIIDCAAMGVKIQGYTKIPAFARLARNTGIKLNRSLIPKGETGIKVVNGKEVLDIDLVEGINIEDENFLDESDNDNVGNIIIGINPKQIGIAMLDDFIDYIIPFHTNKSKDICRKLGVGEWLNYKESQHEKDIDSGKASKHNVNIYTQVINKYHPTNKTEFVDAFLKECRSQMKIPRYSEFLYKEYKSDGAYSDEGGRFDYTYREGYHKLLVDFKMFDKEGNILPQGDIVPELDDAFMAKLIEKEVDRKKTYTFPQEVYDEIDQIFGKGEKVMRQARMGVNKDGIEVYETSKETMNLTWKERVSLFEDELNAQYANKTARFVRNGHTYYAKFDKDFFDKVMYGESHFSKDGKKAFIRAGADGDVFDLIENADYQRSAVDTKNHKKKDGFTDYFDYFFKTVQIDNKVFDILVNIKKQYGTKDGYTYTLYLVDNKKITASPSISIQNAFKSEGNAVIDKSITHPDQNVNPSDEKTFEQKRADNSHSQAALEQFGTTSDFEQTGFVLEDGRMLKLSQYGLKGVNHQRIAQVYDDAKGSEAVNRFIQEGNVRIKATSPGIEIGTETPITVSQLNTISRFISNSLKTRGIFYLDITDANGNEVATKTYYEKASAEEVKYDIKDFYKDGTLPEEKFYYQKRNTDLSPNRELLANALESTIDTTTEEGQEQLKRLKEYKNSIKRIKTLEKQRADLVDKGMELMRKKGKSAEENAELKSIWEQTKSLEKKISLRDKELLRLEALKPIQRLLYREKAKAEKEAKKQGLEKQKEIRENYTRKEYIRKIEERAKGLTNAVKNVGDKHVPAPLREAIADLVLSLDFSSKSKIKGKGETKKDIKFSEAFIELAKLIEHRTPNTADGESSALEEFFVDCDITDEFRQQFTEIKDKVDKIARKYGSEKEALVLRTLSSEQLRQINSALYKLGEQIGKANKLMANNLFKNVTEMSDEFIEYTEKFVQKQDVKWLEKLIDVENLLPYYAFKRMGEVGLSIFNEWADGMDKYAKVAKEVVDFTQDLYTAKEIKDWNNTVHEIEIKGKKLYFTTAHLMSFYCLWKREAAKSHISGYGIRVETFDVNKTAKNPLGKTYTNPTKGVHITEETAQILLGELNKDKRAKEVADALQKFMSTRCAELANEITMKRFGEKAYTEEFYFPMEVNENEKPADGDITAESLYALVNKSFTKQLVPKSTSSLTIRNIFDVFAAHTTDVAAYHSLAMPLLDTLKFYNYKQKGSDAVGDPDAKTVRGQIEHAFGKPFLGYLKNFIKDTTGTSITSDRGSDAVGKWVSRYKIAAVAANLRVIVLQPTSYLRVSAVMKHRYLLKEIKDIPQLNKAVERMNKYSGVSLWKNELGFRDVNISRSLADKIKHADTIGDKVTDIAMKGAELADKITWANIWLACEEEIKATDKSVSVGSEAFYNKVSKRFREVIYSTQVVDSPLAKSNMARSKSFWNRTVTSFMSEPVVSHNLLLDSYHELADTKRRGEKITWGNVCRVGRLVLAYAINATAQSVVESLIDALRATAEDDDEEFVEAYTSEFISNFLRELDPLSKIPIFKDVIDVIRATFSGGYYSGQDMQTAVFDRVAKAIKETMKYYSGESSTTKFIKRVLDALSSLTGIPIGNTYREIKTIWNNTMEMFNDGSGRIE